VKLAVLRSPEHFDVVDAPVPQIQPDEVLIRVANCGVCASELDLWTGKAGAEGFPRYIGHEVSGLVEQVGPEVTAVRPGDPVAVWVTSHGYAEYVAVKAQYCLPAGDLPLELALAEPLACAVNTVELAHVALASDVVILGAGFMGNLVQLLVQLQGPREVIVADLRNDALERARRLGATRVVNARTEPLPDIVRELTEGVGADVSFEVTGQQEPLLLLGQITRMSGTVVLVGYHQGGQRAIPMGHWNYQAYTIANAHFRDVAVIMQGMRTGMRLLRSGRLRLDNLISHRYPLEAINEAFQVVRDKPDGFVKSTIQLFA
jgi:threonine dehydrogenase-like Zn-dependent dehydrogenase